MPELPEVETVVRTIRPALIGRQMVEVQLSRKRLRRSGSMRWSRKLVGQPIGAIERRGKWIIVTLKNGGLLIHLGMTGQLTVVSRDRPVSPHTHVRINLDDNRQLRFRDERRFGSFCYYPAMDDLTRYLDKKLGPEPFHLQSKDWRDRLHRTRRSIKAALLDQAIVAGVGNIYADESLFEARIHPTQPANVIDAESADRLRRALARVMTKAVEYRGSSIRNYLDGNGDRGQYQQEFRVYGRFGDPCTKCRTPIERIRLAGRSTHFCPKCQSSGVPHRRKISQLTFGRE